MNIINNDYISLIKENKHVSIADFFDAIDKLNLKFVVLRETYFVYEDQPKIETTILNSTYEFKQLFPFWYFKYYDYEENKLLGYRMVEGIEDGIFEVSNSNSTDSIISHFIVLEDYVFVYVQEFYVLD